jgi:hypothetical protein
MPFLNHFQKPEKLPITQRTPMIRLQLDRQVLEKSRPILRLERLRTTKNLVQLAVSEI